MTVKILGFSQSTLSIERTRAVHEVSVVLGEGAAGIALASDLPSRTKKVLSEARACVEGRGVRVPVKSADQIGTVVRLVRIKTTPT